MTRDEIKANSLNAEIEKLTARKERNKKTLAKKAAAAEAVGMNITREKWFEVRDTATEKQFAAYFALSIARDELQDTERRIAKLTENSEKVQRAVARHAKIISEEEAERRAAEEIKRWADDGITIKHMTSNYIVGETPKGKFFRIEGNNGITERSLHCFTLQIGADTIFTSGEFYRAYGVIKRS